MRILGIDPGSVATGFGVVERSGARAAHVAHGTLRPPRAASLPERLAFLHDAIARLVVTHRPDAAAIERVFAGRSAQSALVLGQARGAALAALAAAKLPIRELAPQHVKLAVVGYGAAEKAQVQTMVRRLLALDANPPRDAADALAAALCCVQEGRLAALAPAQRSERGRGAGLRIGRVVVRRLS
jgi:crossover junction endodeoxyribonuclease RuvC